MALKDLVVDHPTAIAMKIANEWEFDMTGPELAELVRVAMEKFNALSPAEKLAHREAQKRHWVIGEMLFSNPSMSREYAAKVYDERTEY